MKVLVSFILISLVNAYKPYTNLLTRFINSNGHNLLVTSLVREIPKVLISTSCAIILLSTNQCSNAAESKPSSLPFNSNPRIEGVVKVSNQISPVNSETSALYITAREGKSYIVVNTC